MNSPSIEKSYDVVIIGGGPAGTTAATFLAQQNHSCLVLDRADFPRYHVGESLIPHTYGTFDRLGLLPKLQASHFPQKHSVRFVGSSGTSSDPFYFSETIKGEAAQTWQVDRAEFDQLCWDHAVEHGVTARKNVVVDEVRFDGDRAIGVRAIVDGGDPIDIDARVVVDASGHSTIIGRQLDLLESVPGLNKAAIWSYYRGGKRLDGIDAGETTIFMLPDRGWFWYIPLPDDVISVGIVADPDTLLGGSKDYKEIFLREVERCAPLAARLKDAERQDPLIGVPRLAYRNRQTVGDGWVMIGDAAAFLDPIYSSGIFLAVASAELAAGCIHDALNNDDVSASRLGAFAPPLVAGIEVIRHLIHAFYDTSFSFRDFAETYPEHRSALINCLVGDVIEPDMTSFIAALNKVTPPPPAW